MSKQWHAQQSTAEQLYEQTPDETVQLIWTDPPFGTGQLQVGSAHSYQDGTVADTLALIDHQQAAIEAMTVDFRPSPYLNSDQNDEQRSAYWVAMRDKLAAATPHLRAAWAEEIRAKFLGPDFGRNPVNGQDSPDEALHAAYDEGLQTALALLEGGGE